MNKILQKDASFQLEDGKNSVRIHDHTIPENMKNDTHTCIFTKEARYPIYQYTNSSMYIMEALR